MKKECKASIAPPSLASGDATPCCVRENLPNTAARSSLSLFPRARKKECGISPAVHTAIRSNRRFCCIFPPTTPPKSRLRSHAVAAWQDRRIAQKRNKQPNGKRFLACSSVAPVTVRPSSLLTQPCSKSNPWWWWRGALSAIVHCTNGSPTH
jgi:hypothetical protein